jgi:heme A synthase
MSGMSVYYVSRAAISAALGAVLALTGLEWWMAALLGAIVFAFFVWAPHSGRYAVHPELGITALRRDERTQGINDKAARNAFVVTMLAIAGIAIYFGSVAAVSVPIAMLKWTLVLGMLVYFVSDFVLRRA